DLRVRTDVRIPCPAEEAASVDDVALRGDPIAFADVGDEPAYLHNIAGELVPDRDRRFHAAAGPGIPFVNVDVGAADAGATHTDQNLIVADSRFGNVSQGESRRRRGFHERF